MAPAHSPACRQWRQENKVQGEPWPHSEFRTFLGCTESCLKSMDIRQSLILVSQRPPEGHKRERTSSPHCFLCQGLRPAWATEDTVSIVFCCCFVSKTILSFDWRKVKRNSFYSSIIFSILNMLSQQITKLPIALNLLMLISSEYPPKGYVTQLGFVLLKGKWFLDKWSILDKNVVHLTGGILFSH